tara:strand:- start:2097 stop:2573 length:477 start_codon:yes stop_codon:yes gene_type:complete
MRYLLILLFIPFNSFAQEEDALINLVLSENKAITSNVVGTDIERYKLYPTTNINFFLKLDTSKGLIWLLRKRSSEVDDGIVEVQSKNLALTPSEIEYWKGIYEITGDDFDTTKIAQVGRYKLYPTKNMWNFLLIDVIDGDTYQVQWNPSDILFFKIEN